MESEASADHASRVRQLTSAYVALWNEETEGMPEFASVFTRAEQRENERTLGELLPTLPESLKAYDDLDAEERTALRFRVQKAIVESPFLDARGVPDQFLEAAGGVTEAFVRAARTFDPSIRENDILQALRNLWVFNTIQVLLGRDASLSASSLAYSLLYPYTDNGLDGESRSKEELPAMSLWLEAWFAGEIREPAGPLTARIAGLLRLIEGEYPRGAFPSVFESLRAIHRAQKGSVALHDASPVSPETDLLGITFEKGGTSVVVDGMLVRGSLRAAEEEALFGYGVLLQLVDDIQDLGEDRLARHSTPFVRAAEGARLEGATCRFLRFSERVIALMKKQLPSKHRRIHDIIGGSVLLLVAGAVARNRNPYSAVFLERIERAVPYRLEFLAGLNHPLCPLDNHPSISYLGNQ